MMNIPDTAGESSCKRQENGDASTGSERPLKKARFAWQVKGKGKYHMKSDASESKTSFPAPDEPDKPGPSQSESNAHSLVGNTEQNLEILGDYLLKQDFNTLDSVIADSDKSLLKPSTNTSSTEKLEYPRYVSSFERSGSSASSRPTETVELPMSYLPQTYTEDQCIARWQARQMAKGFVDNTINRVLDSWMVAPLPADIGNRFLALDVAEFINNLPGDNSIENEGILMAISAHGLQNNSASSSNESQNESSMEEQNLSTKDSFPSRSSSPMPSEEEHLQNNNKSENSDMNDLMSWSCENDDMNNSTTFDSSSSYLNYAEDELVNDYASHYDFVDAAVSFAIQNKGLTSFGTEYG